MLHGMSDNPILLQIKLGTRLRVEHKHKVTVSQSGSLASHSMRWWLLCQYMMLCDVIQLQLFHDNVNIL